MFKYKQNQMFYQGVRRMAAAEWAISARIPCDRGYDVEHCGFATKREARRYAKRNYGSFFRARATIGVEFCSDSEFSLEE